PSYRPARAFSASPEDPGSPGSRRGPSPVAPSSTPRLRASETGAPARDDSAPGLCRAMTAAGRAPLALHKGSTQGIDALQPTVDGRPYCTISVLAHKGGSTAPPQTVPGGRMRSICRLFVVIAACGRGALCWAFPAGWQLVAARLPLAAAGDENERKT